MTFHSDITKMQSQIAERNALLKQTEYADLLNKPFVPMADRIYVRLLDFGEVKTQSGIILNSAVENANNKFVEVLYTGTGRVHSNGKFVPCIVEPGDILELEEFEHVRRTPITGSDGNEYFVIREADIKNIITNDEDHSAAIQARVRLKYEEYQTL